MGIAYDILLKGGYLSNHHHFVFGESGLLFVQNEGPMILSGSGVCRNITFFLDDLFFLMGISSRVTFIRKHCFDTFSIPENKTTFFDMQVYDHCMNFVYNDHNPYFLDATKQMILEYVGDNTIQSVVDGIMQTMSKKDINFLL